MQSLLRIFPSMFHRRLLLLVVLFCAGLLLLSGQVVRLTLAHGSDLRKRAFARLVREQWLPTSRGAILDRKGRVLAMDRPSYNVALAYRVLTGEWCDDVAHSSAKRAAGHTWWDVSPEQRRERIAQRQAVLRGHLDSAFDLLAARAGMTREELDARRDRVIQGVEAKFASIKELRRLREEAALKDQGKEVTDAARAAIETRIGHPISEQLSAHVLIPNVPDGVAFACMLLAGEDVEVEFPSPEPTAEPPGAERIERIPGLSVIDTGEREYPLESVTIDVDRSTLPGPLRAEGTIPIEVEGLACHVLGRVRDQVQAGDREAREAYLASHDAFANTAYADLTTRADRGEYREGDRVGDTGIERAQEHLLRGLRGLRVIRADSVRAVDLPPVPGTDLRLTLDAMLQARVQAAMTPKLGLSEVQPWHHTQKVDAEGRPIPGALPDGAPLYGAAVVLDIDTAEILAMVSTPTITRAQARDHPETVFGDTPELRLSTPYLNRAIAKAYQPGSIVKALVLSEAITRGIYRPDERIECTGHLLPDRPTMYRCWIYKRNGVTHTEQLGEPLDGVQALMVSCNIFYFTLGKRLGPEGIVGLFRAFGVCEPFHLGVGMEFAGELGHPRRTGDGARTLPGDGGNVTAGDAIQMGIGQGPITWTPLHAADAYATLARGGARIPPRLIGGGARPEPKDLQLDPRSVDLAIEGLSRAVNEPLGTGRILKFDDATEEPIFNAPGVKIWGKTGTAAASPVVADPDGEGPDPRQVIGSGDHSWFVVMVGRDRPRYVIAVVSDFGGSGGKVSGPIANQIIHALIAEGYL